ncbi:hypothetical protein [Roseibium sp. Sym1]|uniref:hypothetical protein n=1 Tax=Roseibium sp. Sym1 TaxID=3016006 RepID=UPI0022B43825|nr:hypothetical protein [Roseibium sp. Sym1]
MLMCFALIPAAHAQTRRQPDTTKLTCAQTHELINRFGRINLKSGPHKFDRYVTNRSQCFTGQTVRTTFVPTIDSKRCSVLICAETGHRNN